MTERKKGGRPIVHMETNNLVQCTFRTSAYNKERLIELAQEREQTMSETLSDLLTSRFEEIDYVQKWNKIMRLFITEISNNNQKKADEYKEILLSIKHKNK